MKGTKQSRRLAKQLFKSCQVDSLLNADRVRKAVSLLIEQKPRGYFGILQNLQRLVKLDEAGRMIEFTVLARPPNGVDALKREMMKRVPPRLAALSSIS